MAGPAVRRARAGRPFALLAALCLCLAPPARAQAPAGLQFLGLQPGQPRVELLAEVRRMGGTPACTAATGTPIEECTATLPAGRAGPVTPALSMRAVLVDAHAAIVLVRGRLTGEELTRWTDALVAAYGPGRRHAGGGQPTREWILGRTMLRLTTRPDGDRTDTSVSLVDGPRLDGLGRR